MALLAPELSPDALAPLRAEIVPPLRSQVNPAIVLIFSDVVTTLATVATVALVGHPGVSGSADQLGSRLMFFALTSGALLTAFVVQGWRGNRRRSLSAEVDRLPSLCGTVLMGVLIALALADLGRTEWSAAPGAQDTIVACLLCLVSVQLGRVSCRRLLARRGGASKTRILVLGTGKIAEDVGERLRRTPGMTLVGYVDDEPAGTAIALGPIADLAEICRKYAVDRVIVAFSRSHPQEMSTALRSVRGMVAIDVVPRYFDLTGWSAQFRDLHGLPVVTLDAGIASDGALLVKRGFDILVASFGLMISAPVLFAAAIAIKASSRGPVCFRQQRLGRAGRVFTVVKLRTMRPPSPDDQPAQTDSSRPDISHETDPRITRVGRILRRTGIDELPQFLNVLRGDMAVVGPRPLVPSECSDLEGWARRRFDVRPGLTGSWQVCGQHDLHFDEMCRLDYLYVASWSLRADAVIVARTPARLLRGGGGDLWAED